MACSWGSGTSAVFLAHTTRIRPVVEGSQAVLPSLFTSLFPSLFTSLFPSLPFPEESLEGERGGGEGVAPTGQR